MTHLKPKGKKGQQMVIGLLFLFMTIVVLIALIPALREILDLAQQSDNLNCAGFDYGGSGAVGDNVLDYNSSLHSETTGCIAIKLYLPYILLVVLIGGVAKLMYGGQQQQPVY